MAMSGLNAPGESLAGSWAASANISPSDSSEVKTAFVPNTFEINSSRISDTNTLDRLCLRIDSLLTTDSMQFMGVAGRSSIDGSEALNLRLSGERAKAVKEYIAAHSRISPSSIKTRGEGENWEDLLTLAEADRNLPMRDAAIAVIASKESLAEKERKLRALADGEVWEYLKAHILPATRKTVVTVVWRDAVKMVEVISDAPAAVPEPVELPEPEPAEVAETVEIVETVETETVEPAVAETPLPSEPLWQRKLYLKTNAPAWVMLWTNIAVEIDLARHFSAQLPVYYSGFNYFRRDVKFRTLTLQPEVRWWPRADNMGFFANIHAGVAWYNYAKGGDNRYQDHNRNTPAVGGGIGIGYRFHFTASRRWTMEASVGAGIYRLDYDIFNNVPNGLITGRRQRTFYGIDHAALSFSYSFGVGKKGGEE